jgi:perosamine synthetase
MSELPIIPVLRPNFGQEEIDAVAEVLKSGWAGLGPKTKEFEEAFATYLDCDFVIGLNSGTAALHLAALGLQLKPGDEVIVTPITFVSTAHVIRYCDATPVFADVEPDTLNLDVEDVERKITEKTRAIFCVHYGGHPCDMDRLRAIAEPRGIDIVEDAAHAAGASYKGRKIGTISDLTCFSFHAVKNLAMGEGGAISCNSDWFASYFASMRWLGITKDTYSRTVNDKVYAWQYWVDKLGYKCHLHDVSAAIGLVQLKKLDENNKKRGEIACRYHGAFEELDWLELPVTKDYAQPSWHLYVIKLKDRQDRDDMIRHLKEHNISPGVHYYPINLHPYYKDSRAVVPVANEIWKRILSLPMYPGMTDADQERVIEAVRSFQPHTAIKTQVE